MRSGEEIGKMMTDVYKAIPTGCSIFAGGNVGMALLAGAVEEHAKAMNRLADAMVLMANPSDKVRECLRMAEVISSTDKQGG